jgi:hypothetical protein
MEGTISQLDVLRCGISIRARAAWGQNEKGPSPLRCPSSPGADIRHGHCQRNMRRRSPRWSTSPLINRLRFDACSQTVDRPLQLQPGSARTVSERFQHGIPQQDWIVLPAFRQLEHSLGDHSHSGVLAVNETQGAQSVFECGRDDGDFFRREDPTSEKKRPNRHGTDPVTSMFLPHQPHSENGTVQHPTELTLSAPVLVSVGRTLKSIRMGRVRNVGRA